jgi:hypothetical protein
MLFVLLLRERCLAERADFHPAEILPSAVVNAG